MTQQSSKWRISKALEEHFGSTDLPDSYRMTELGPLPQEWRVVRLREVANLERGISWSKADENADGIGVLSIPNIEEGGCIKLIPRVFVQKPLDREKLLAKGDALLVGSSGSLASVGRSGIIDSNTSEPLTFASFTVRVRTRSPQLEQAFLWFLLRSRWIDFSRVSKRAADGKYNLQLQRLRDYLIPLPPLPEQRAIAHVLHTVQRAKEATERVIAALKELKKSLMRHLFTHGPVPVDAADQVLMQETEIGPTPSHWRVVRLGEVILTIQNGSTKEQNKRGQGIPVTRIETIALEAIDPTRVGYVEKMSADEIEKYRLRIGDILFSHINSEAQIGKSSIYEGNPPLLIHGMNLLLIRTDPTKCNPYFLNYLFKLYREKGIFAGLAARAVGQASINQGKMKGLIIPVPPLPEQQQIARILQAVDEKICAEEARRQALEALFKALLHQLMTGKLRVVGLLSENPESPS